MYIYVYDPKRTNERTIAAREYGTTQLAWTSARRETFDATIGLIETQLTNLTLTTPTPPLGKPTQRLLLAYKTGTTTVGLRAALLATIKGNSHGVDETNQARAIHYLVERVESDLNAPAEAVSSGASDSHSSVSMSIVGEPGTAVVPGRLVTAVFTLENLSRDRGAFSLSVPATIAAPSGAAPVRGYVVANAANAVPFEVLSAQLATMTFAHNDTLSIGVQYEVPDANLGQSIIARLGGVSVVIDGTHSTAVQDIVVDTVRPHPLVEIAPAKGQAVVPGSIATARFALTNGSGQPAVFELLSDAVARIPLADPLSIAYTLGGQAVPRRAAEAYEDLNDALAAQPVPAGGTRVVGVQYTGPAGTKGKDISTTLVVRAIAGSVTGVQADATVIDTIGDPPEMQLEGLARELVLASRQALTPKAADALLKQAAQIVANVTNESEPIAVTPKLLAWTLAIAEAMQIIFNKAMSQEQAAQNFDPPVPIPIGGAGYR